MIILEYLRIAEFNRILQLGSETYNYQILPVILCRFGHLEIS